MALWKSIVGGMISALLIIIVIGLVSEGGSYLGYTNSSQLLTLGNNITAEINTTTSTLSEATNELLSPNPGISTVTVFVFNSAIRAAKILINSLRLVYIIPAQLLGMIGVPGYFISVIFALIGLIAIAFLYKLLSGGRI